MKPSKYAKKISDSFKNDQQNVFTNYIYIYIVLFGPVKPKLGVIPSGQKKNSAVNI